MIMTKTDLLKQLAEAWDNGYSAGWDGCNAADDASRKGKPEPDSIPNPYA